MRFAWTACKFEGLHFCHQFFYDLMRLFGALSLNVMKKSDQKMARTVWKDITPEYLEKLYI